MREGCEEFLLLLLIFFCLDFLFVVLNMFNMLNECLKDFVGHHDFGKWDLKDLISRYFQHHSTVKVLRYDTAQKTPRGVL